MGFTTIASITASIVSAVAIVVLVKINKRLVKETRLARRDDPELKAYPRELSEEKLRFRRAIAPSGTFLAFDVLLVNPGAVPIVIENVEEEITERESGEKVTTHPEFALPRDIRAELPNIYIFILPWAIPSDGFAVWSRYLKLDTNEDSKYVLNVKFDYSVAEKSKSMTAGPFPLTPWHGSGYRGTTS